jgi:hypothetical protein
MQMLWTVLFIYGLTRALLAAPGLWGTGPDRGRAVWLVGSHTLLVIYTAQLAGGVS